LLRTLRRMTSKTRATSGLVFARRAAAAVVAGDGSRGQQAGNKSKDARLLTRHNAGHVELPFTCYNVNVYRGKLCVCCFVFIKPILGNRYGPGVIP